MSKNYPKFAPLLKKRSIFVRNVRLLFMVSAFAFTLTQLTDVGPHSNIAYADVAGATLTPTIPQPVDTAVPTNTPIPPTLTPTNTPLPATNTPEPTATNPPSNNGGGQAAPPTPTATTLPVQEIPELGVAGAIRVTWVAAVLFLIVLIWTCLTVLNVVNQGED